MQIGGKNVAWLLVRDNQNHEEVGRRQPAQMSSHLWMRSHGRRARPLTRSNGVQNTSQNDALHTGMDFLNIFRVRGTSVVDVNLVAWLSIFILRSEQVRHVLQNPFVIIVLPIVSADK